MRDLDREIRPYGVELTVIGNGSPDEARGFQKEYLGHEVRLLTDPDLNGHEALALKRSLWSSFRPRAAILGFRLFRRGFRPGSSGDGDSWQQGGAFLITPAGEVPFSFYGSSSDDRVDPAAVLAAVRALRARGPVSA